MKFDSPPVSREPKVGASPGALIHVGERHAETIRIELLDYDADRLERRELGHLDEALPHLGRDGVSWVNVDGLHDPVVIGWFGEHAGLHPLTLEDLMNTRQRPKLEEYPDYLFLVVKMIRADEAAEELAVEQVGLVLGPRFLITFQEQRGDVFDAIRGRIEKPGSRARTSGNDYLAYALVDTIVDHYFVVLEVVGEAVDELESELIGAPGPEVVHRIHQLKRTMLRLRRMVWPLRDVLASLQRCESPVIKDETRLFLRDVYDHAIQVIDSIEAQRDVLSGLHDLYLSSLSLRMNEVMRMLTVIATIFMPLTFVVGIYGMNFKHMPELEWRWGYAAVWLLLVALTGGMILLFRRRRLL